MRSANVNRNTAAMTPLFVVAAVASIDEPCTEIATGASENANPARASVME
jgi:hypothetical protein